MTLEIITKLQQIHAQSLQLEGQRAMLLMELVKALEEENRGRNAAMIKLDLMESECETLRVKLAKKNKRASKANK